MKIKNTIVIVKLENNNCHQVILTKTQEALLLEFIDQLHSKSIKLNEEKLTTIDLYNV